MSPREVAHVAQTVLRMRAELRSAQRRHDDLMTRLCNSRVCNSDASDDLLDELIAMLDEQEQAA